MASAEQTRNNTVAQADKTQADEEASAAETFAGSAWSAWKTELTGAVEVGVTYKKAFAGAVRDSSDDVAGAAHERVMKEGDGVRAARGDLILADAEARNKAAVGQAEATAAQREEWKTRANAGLPLNDLDYVAFYPVHKAALASLEPSVIETFIPIWGTAYSASNNFSKGNITAGVFDLALGLPGGWLGRSLRRPGGMSDAQHHQAGASPSLCPSHPVLFSISSCVCLDAKTTTSRAMLMN